MKLFISDGGKGGVGKSQTALALINYLSANNEKKLLVVETDTQNPDVARCIGGTGKENISVLLADLRNEDGWNDLLEKMEELSSEFDYGVISLPGADVEIGKFINLIAGIFKELGVAVTELFTINRTKDSINLFCKSRESGFGSIAEKTVVILNGTFGDRNKFERWDDSSVRKKHKPLEIYMPDLFWKTFDLCRDSTITLDEILNEEISVLHKTRITEWVQKMNSEFKKLGLGD